MFDLGIQELIVIFVVALIVFGPKRLPELGKTLGKGMLELRKAMEGIREQMHAESEAISKPLEGGGEEAEKKDATAAEAGTAPSAPEGPYPSEGEGVDGGAAAKPDSHGTKSAPHEERKEDKVDDR